MFRSFFSPGRTVTGPATINPIQLQQRIDAGEDVILLDVRSPEEFAHDGHISGARLMPLFTLPVRHNELPRDQPIVCVCRSGSRSHFACEQLASLGFTNVTNLVGGMISWRSSGLPVA